MNHAPGHQPRKRFGQNFLHDDNVIQRIVHAINPRPDDRLVEIGPGEGAITEQLLLACPTLQVIELDRDLIPLLLAKFISRFPDFRVHQCDALKFDFSQLQEPHGPPLRIVGNLPYNISTPIIFHLLGFRDLVRDMHFMLQKEVVARLAAGVGSKAYGRLSVMTQYYCQVEALFEVAPESFTPRPRVDSAIVRLQPWAELPHAASDVKILERLVNQAFQQRRKTLRNALKHSFTAAGIEATGIDPGLRPEQVSLAEYVKLAESLARRQTEEHGP